MVKQEKPSSVWDDDDDEDLLLCAAQVESGLETTTFVKSKEVSPKKSQSGIPDNFSSSKRVPKLPKFAPKVEQVSNDIASAAKKVKHEPNPSVSARPSTFSSKVSQWLMQFHHRLFANYYLKQLEQNF